MTSLIGQGVTVRRGGREILRRADVAVTDGRFTAVIGANGAGKSTLLRCLAGLLSPDAGSVSLDGKPLAQWRGADLARVRAFLPQQPRAEWPISVERLVALGLTPSLPAFGPLTAAMQRQVEAALLACDLETLAQQPATTLSGGELARAMLARTLVGDPKALIVDEPVAGLDPRHALDVMGRLRDLARGGRLVIASVHDLTLAARYADRLVALRDGRIVADGPTAEILTSDLLEQVFGVRSRISETAEGPLVDLTSPL